jgi:hypothetical protein
MPLTTYGYVPDPETEKEKFKDYMKQLNRIIFGEPNDSGTLDSDNGVVSSDTDLYTSEDTRDDVAAFIQDGDALTWAHDDSGNTLIGEVTKASDVTDAVASTVSVTSPDATDLASVITLANENKADTNTLVTDVNAIKDVLNNVITALQTAKLMET